jgi:hypothetical protein
MTKAIWPHGDYGDMDLENWVARNERLLGPHRTDVSRAWRRNAMDLYFPRACFERAIQFVTLSRHLPEAVYVFGQAACGGIQQHGWVELPGGVVFDGTMQEFYAAEGYNRQATPWYRYDRQATMYLDRLIRRYANYSYRWHSVLGQPWSDYINVPVMDLETAKRHWRDRPRRDQRPCDLP